MGGGGIPAFPTVSKERKKSMVIETFASKNFLTSLSNQMQLILFSCIPLIHRDQQWKIIFAISTILVLYGIFFSMC